ncbi:MAG: sugar phosphate isomerase/epimerase [Phycisphaerales bacterium]|nr:sugar phosphate isomerase/epimerase [Phycisphaerales bacterium]
MSLDRRTFLAHAATAAGASGLLALPAHADDHGAPSSPTSPRRPLRIGVSTYSFWHFRGDPPDLRTVIDQAGAMGFDGVEILHMMMPTEDNAYLQELKHRAFVNGLDLMGFSIHQGFVTPDADERQRNIDHTIRCIELAYALGIPTLRLNTGRWRTIADFDELMANKGVEPILPGHTEDEGFKWCIDSIQRLIPHAEKCGVCMGLENHWGLGRTAAGVMRIVEAVNSPWLQVTLDTGNFLENWEPQIRQMAPRAVLVQAKTYYGGGEWYTLEIDYPLVARILREAGFKGYVSLEFEGKDPAETGVPRSLDLLRRAFA